MHEQHIKATAQQMQHEHTASTNHDLYAKANRRQARYSCHRQARRFCRQGYCRDEGGEGHLDRFNRARHHPVKSLGAVSPATTTNTSTATANAHLNTGAAKLHKTVGADFKHANAHPGPKGPVRRQAKTKQTPKQNG